MRENWWHDYMHIPFEDLGRSEKGADCYGLVRLVYEREFDVILPSMENYENTLDRQQINENVNNIKDGLFYTPATPESGDVIILRMCGLPMHIGLVTKPGFMIHCSKDIGVSLENYTGMKWKNKVLGFARYDRNSSKIK